MSEPDDPSQLRLNLQVARHHGWLIELNARRMPAVSDGLGVGRPKPDTERISKFCTMNGADFARYLDAKEPRQSNLKAQPNWKWRLRMSAFDPKRTFDLPDDWTSRGGSFREFHGLCLR